MQPEIHARIEYIKVTNFRVLRAVELRNLTPMTILIGPNGSGKSTVFDVLAFLSECFEFGLRRAWDRRGRAKEIKTKGQDFPVTITIKYREGPKREKEKINPLITYMLSVDEKQGAPFVAHERLIWNRKGRGRPFHFLDYKEGQGHAVSGEYPDNSEQRLERQLQSADLLAVNALGQFAEHPCVAALRDFITRWHVSSLSPRNARNQPESGPEESLNRDGSNLANVVQFLDENERQRLGNIIEILRHRVPQIEDVRSIMMPDGRQLLQFIDTPFNEPILARFSSEGTLKMLAYLVLLHSSNPPSFIGIEEPENFLHPRLLPELAAECRAVCERTQLLVATHSPFFLNPLQAREVRILWRNDCGHTQTRCVADIAGVEEFVEAGATLGDLWMEGRFGLGEPLSTNGFPLSWT